MTAVVHTALLGGVLWLISDDKRHIAREPEGTLEYALPNTDACVSAITFGHFVEQHLDAPIDLYEVDGRWLHLAHDSPGRPLIRSTALLEPAGRHVKR
jgi:hypothetical protein